MQCEGFNLDGRRCSRKVKTGESLCFQHQQIYHQEKPDQCIICYESMVKQRRPLSCGHWIHLSCVIQSAKAECPICRAEVKLGKRAMGQIQKLAQQRREETLVQEELEILIQELARRLQNHPDFNVDFDMEIDDEIIQGILYYSL